MTARRSSVVLLFVAALLAGCGDEPAQPKGPLAGIAPERLDPIVKQFNKGVGLMDRYRPIDAVKAFEEVVRLAPNWVTGRLNLGIALLNSQSEEYYKRAEVVLKEVIAIASDNPYAHYALGMLLRHLMRHDEAKKLFERVLEIDPQDPDAHYQLAILITEKDPVAARGHLEKTLEKIPHHVSACYRLQTLLRQAGERKRAVQLLKRFQALKTAKAGAFSGMKYGEMGHYAAVVRTIDLPDSGASPKTPSFTDVAAASGLTLAARGSAGWPGSSGANPPAFGPGIGVADVDGDGDLDAYITQLGDGGVLYLNDGKRFTPAAGPGIDGRDAIGAWFGDYDRDGDPDLYLTCAGANRLYKNDGKAKFTDVTEPAGVGGGAYLSIGASWSDADHDGDLDLYVANFSAWPADPSQPGAPNVLLRNDRNGKFTEVAKQSGVDGGSAPTTGVVFFDVDDDLDLDLYVVNHNAPNLLYLNDRVGQYRDVSDWFPGLADDGPGLGALVGDVDGNGREDLVLLRGEQPARLFSQVSRGRFEPNAAFDEAMRKSGGAASAALADVDADGRRDLVLLGAGAAGKVQHRVLVSDGKGGLDSPIPFGDARDAPDARGAVAADFDGDGSPELLVARAGSPPQLWRTQPPAGRHWLQVVPTKLGEQNKAEPMTVGLKVEVKTGQRFQVASVTSSSGYLASPPPRMHFGLGLHEKADYVRLVWPDAGLQSELEVAADQTWRVKKVVRKPSSCPVLFSWDGERFACVTDFLGVGGVGFFMTPAAMPGPAGMNGEYAPPDPSEDVRIPPELAAIKDGRYLLRVAEPLEEVLYLDELELLVYDHPSGQEIYPDERFTGTPPWPTGRPQAVAQKAFPVSARNDRGDDVLERVLHIDRRYVEPPKDKRFKGYAHDHWLELDFGDRLAHLAPDARVVLYLYGWVEYTYSHVNYA
ncbi:MAG: hypothetical protein CMJ85_12765, partial [Planctomycetes bacterium]|nr:hypothetical protein [Planctomycetota bacterium]